MAFIAGAYTASLGGSMIGEVQDGFEIEYTPLSQEIRGDSYGEMVQDEINLGVDMFVNCTLLATNNIDDSAHGLIIWPWLATVGDVGVIGGLYTSIDVALILAPIAGSPAAGITTPTWTFASTILASGVPLRFSFNSRLRVYELRWRVYPSSAGVFFTRS